jgi:hypothetical protein
VLLALWLAAIVGVDTLPACRALITSGQLAEFDWQAIEGEVPSRVGGAAADPWADPGVHAQALEASS